MSRKKPVSKILVLNTDEWLGGPSAARAADEEERDEVEEAMRKVAKRKVDKLKMMEIDKYLLETEKELKELKREVGGNPEKYAGEQGGEITPGIAMELAKLPEEQRHLVMQTYIALKSAEKGGGSALAYMLPMLIGYMKANPQAGQNDIVKFAEVVANQIKTGIDLARASQQPSQSSYDPITLIKTFSEAIRENLQKPLEELMERVQPQPSVFEQLIMNDTLFERAKALGLFGGAQPQQLQQSDKDLMLRIEELKTERDIKLKEMEQEFKRWMAEQQLEQQKWQQIVRIIEGPVGNVLQTIGRAGADRIRTTGAPAPQPPDIRVEQIQCPKCGKSFYANVLADYAVCAYCGSILAKSTSSGASSQSTGGAGSEEGGEGEQGAEQ